MQILNTLFQSLNSVSNARDRYWASLGCSFPSHTRSCQGMATSVGAISQIQADEERAIKHATAEEDRSKHPQPELRIIFSTEWGMRYRAREDAHLTRPGRGTRPALALFKAVHRQ